MFKLFFLFLILLSLFPHLTQSKCEVYVDPKNGSDESPEEDKCRESLPYYETVCLKQGTYLLNDPISLINKKIQSLNGSELTTIDGSLLQDTCIKIKNPKETTISGLTIQNCGSTNNEIFGGAVSVSCDQYQDSERMTIEDCIIKNNQAQTGGGIYNHNCQLALTNVEIRDNSASEYGGGFACKSLDTKLMVFPENVLIVNNSAHENSNVHNYGYKESAEFYCYLDGSVGGPIRDCDECYGGGNCELSKEVCVCQPGSSGPSPQCEYCGAGTFSTSINAEGCTRCDAGNYNNKRGETQCYPCSPGFFNGEPEATECRKCERGTFSNSEGSLSCTTCPAGTYQDAGGQTECIKCERGTSNPRGGRTTKGSCVNCPRGTYGEREGLAYCAQCPFGTYMDQDGQTECTKCARGKYNDHTGASAESGCISCGRGTYGDREGLQTCKQCGLGQYQDQEEQTACKICPNGTFSNSGGSRVCTACAAGKYQDQEGQTECTDCAGGQYQDQEEQDRCKSCPAGTYSSKLGSGSKSGCVACEIGRYNEHEAQQNCTICPMGTFNSQEGQTGCSSCLAGMYSDKRGQNKCQFCLPGTYADLSGRVKCSDCPVNTYEDGLGSKKCKPCPMHSQTLSKKTTTYKECFCSVGYYGAPGGNCKACPAGGVCNTFNQLHPYPDQGYWSSSEDPDSIIKCKVFESCSGGDGQGEGEGADNCNRELGYGGERCESCVQGFYKFEGHCSSCPNNNSFRLFVAIIIFLAFAGVLLLIAKKGQNYFGSLSILISFFQIIALFPNLDFNWPDRFTRFFNTLTAFNFNIEILALDCSMDLSYTEKWFMILLLPIGIVSLFVLAYLLMSIHSKFTRKVGKKILNSFPALCTRPDKTQHNIVLRQFYRLRYFFMRFWISGMDKHALTDFKNNCINTYVAFLFLMYLILSLKILEIFNCEKISNNSEGKEYVLSANASYYCYDDWWYRILPIAIVFGIMYIVGIPLFLIWMLRYHSKNVDDKTFNARLGLLCDRYQKQYFFWEFVLMSRKLIVVLIVVYMSESSLLQLIIFLILFLVSIVIQSLCKPFDSSPRNLLEFSLLCLTLFILYMGMIFLFEKKNEFSENTQGVLSGILIIIIFISLFFWVTVVFLEFKSSLTEKKIDKKIQIKKSKNSKLGLYEKKLIHFIQKKPNLKLLLSFLASRTKSKKQSFRVFCLLKQFLSFQNENSKVWNSKNAKTLKSYNSLWNDHMSLLFAKWYQNKSSLIYKIKISQMLKKYIRYRLEMEDIEQKYKSDRINKFQKKQSIKN